jgi:type III secretion protein C
MGKSLYHTARFLKFVTIVAIFFVNILSINNAATAATPTFWKEAGYVYSANQTPIKRILEDFATQFGVSLDINASIKGTIDGRIASNNAVDFLDRLALMRKFRWFVYANTLYITPLSDNVVEKIKTSSESAAESKQAIIGIGLFDAKFGWGELPEEQSVLISGPSKYVGLIKKVLSKTESKRQDLEIMIFRLKYADAQDREIQYRNRIAVTPGVASILRNLLQDKRAKGGGANFDLGAAAANSNYMTGGNSNNAGYSTGSQNNNPLGRNSEQSRGNGSGKAPANPFSFLSGGNGGEANASLDGSLANSGQNNYLNGFSVSGSNSSSKDNKNTVPLVEADARLNAVVIRDNPSKRDYYQALINEFDQEPKMVEIEAMIIDINRSKMRDIGIDWTAKAGGTTVGFSPVATAGLSLSSSALGAGSSILINNISNFYARIRALEQDGEAYILAKPSVLTVDNLGAVLDLNRTAYISLVGERVADVMPVTAGTLLKVTPRVITESSGTRIHLVVDIEDGELQEKQGSSTPSVQRSTISTQAIIEENQALVIGGYQSQTDSRSKQKIPLLGDIPGFGAAFTRTNNDTTNKERIFIIVPRAMARNYNRTYGNNVAGQPLPPTHDTQRNTLATSSNGKGQILYANNGNNDKSNIPANPFSRTSILAPPPAEKAIFSPVNTLSSPLQQAPVIKANAAKPVRDVSAVLLPSNSYKNNANTVVNAKVLSSGPNTSRPAVISNVYKVNNGVTLPNGKPGLATNLSFNPTAVNQAKKSTDSAVNSFLNER